MYKCEKCNKQVQANVPERKVVTEKRDVKYSNGSEGWEIVKEIRVCPDCDTETK